MEMQDKEFDQLFNSKLNDFEIEPSPMVWDNIVAELDGNKERKRSIMPYLSIAASVIVLAAATVLFFNRDVKKDDDKPVKLVKETKPVKSSIDNVDNAPVKKTVENDISLKKIAATGSPGESKLHLNKSNTAERVKEDAPAMPAAPIVEKPEPLLAAMSTETTPVLQPTIPAIDGQVNNKLMAAADVEPTIGDQPGVLAASASPRHVETKKRARGLGGLINTIVAAVDKRDDKLIEFTDADNDEGTKVTAVNLGIFKIKKQ